MLYGTNISSMQYLKKIKHIHNERNKISKLCASSALSIEM